MDRKRISHFALWTLLSIAFFTSIVVIELVSKNVPAPYMDEEFHYDQLRSYAISGDFNYWNEKITTFPGLYLTQYPLIKLLQMAGYENFNLLKVARSINAFVFSMFSIYFIYKIFTHLYPETPSANIQKTLLFYFMPTNFFFNFLLYTDPGSTLFILITFYLTMTGRFKLGALAGAVAVGFRQTNIVWVGYMCIWKIIRDKRHHFLSGEARLNLGHQISLLIAILVKDVTVILSKLYAYILVVIAFIYFVIVNRGIVVGDKSNHQVSFHPTQLLYFSLFLLPNLAIGLRHILRNLKLSVIRIFSNSVMFSTWLMLTTFFCVVVHYFTIPHPFILADNRHYIFYLWKNFIGRYWWFKYALCPFYSTAVLFMIPIIISSKEKVIVFSIWLLCTCVTLLPSPLIEFRYYMLPWLFLQFEIKPFGGEVVKKEKKEESAIQRSAIGKFVSSLYPVIIGYILVDIATLYVFLYKPFVYNGEVGRFMW